MPHLHYGASALFQVGLALALILIACGYAYGRWRRRAKGSDLSAWRAGSFFLGLFCIWVAAASPLAELDHELLTVHMIQHLLLMTLAPPLLWLGEPVGPAQHPVPALAQFAICWSAATAVLVVWHVPAFLALTMRSNAWHVFQHASFLASGLLFWRPVILRPTSASSGHDWSIVLYLFLATLPCDILAAFLVFSERIVYPVYLTDPRRSTLSVLEDQQAAGALMWTVVTIVYLAAGAIVATRSLSLRHTREDVEVA